MEPIFSFTAKELLDARDGDFIHHDKYTSELSEPELEYAYCNTLKFSIKSSKYGKKDKKTGGTIVTKYKVFILFEDFYTIGKDKDINFEDAINYAIEFGDLHCRCTCPASQFWGYNYEASALRYLYGVPRENRFPHVRNPNLQGTICKHTDKVLQWILKHTDIVAQLFAVYYNRLSDEQSIYAVNENGNTIIIGRKNSDGDVFFERQLEEEETMKDMEEMTNPPEEADVEETSEDIDNLNPDSWWEDEDNVTEV